MSKSKRIFWVVTLALFVNGCSSYKAVSPPRSEGDRHTTAERDSAARVGDQVAITLTDGGRVEGKIIAVSSEALTLDGIEATDYTKYPENLDGDSRPRMIALDSIQTIERQKSGFGGYVLLLTGLFVVVIGVVLATGPGPGINIH